MKISPEMVQVHREVLEKYPAGEKCVCDPAYGVWCAFHVEFRTNMSQRSRELLAALADSALTLHEAIRDYLAYPVAGNHKKVSAAVGGGQTLIELYLKERGIDHEREREILRKRDE